MGDNGNGVGPTNPRPKNHYGWSRDSLWYYINDELVQTFTLGPATGVKPDGDWILSFTGEGATKMGHERACARLAPRALHELYVEAKGLSPDARQTGHTVGCGLCGKSIPLEKIVPNRREEPIHKRCYVDAYGEPVWVEDY